MTMNFLWIIPLLLLLTTAYAQEINSVDAQENLFKIGGGDARRGVVRKFDNRYEGVKGSPFYFDYWAEGVIITQKGQQLENVKLKYNLHEDELIINRSNAGQYYFPKNKIKSFILKEKLLGTNIHFIKNQHPKKKEEFQYYRIIFAGTVNLVEYTKVIFEKADFEGGYSSNKRYDEFKKYPSIYYFSASSPQPSKLKTSANAISKLFPDHNSEIKNYIISNGLDCKNEQNLIKVFHYYESIE